MKKKKENGNKKSKKKIFVILGVVLVVVLIVALLMIFVFGKKEEKIEFKHDWQEKYYDFIKADLMGQEDAPEEKRLKNVESVSKMVQPKMYFLEVGLDDPAMVIESEAASKENKDQVEECYRDGSLAVYGISENNNVVGTTYCRDNNLVYMYNIEEKEYGWYVEDISEAYYTYYKVEDVVEKDTDVSDDDEAEEIDDYEYRFDAQQKDVLDKIAEKLIKIEDVTLEGTLIDKDFQEKDLQEAIEKTTTELKDEEKFATEEVKDKVTDTLKQMEEKKKAKEEEMKRAEEEAQKKAVEEAQKKAQSTTQNSSSGVVNSTNGVKVGSHTLTYGRYVSIMQEAPVEIVINKDGTCTYKGVDPNTGSGNYNTTCTYSVKRMDLYGYGNMDDVIEFALATGKRASFEVNRDYEFSSDWLALTLR